MRCFRPLRARKDIVELLVRQGRLADIQMLSFFSIQLQRETSAEAATAAAVTPKAGDTATMPPTTAADGASTESVKTAAEPASDADAAAATAAATAAAAAAAAAQAVIDRQAAKKQAWTSLRNRSDAIRSRTMQDSPMAWIAEVHGTREEWSASFLTSTHAVATRVGSNASAQLRASGKVTAVGSGDARDGAAAAATAVLPASVRVVLRVDEGEKSATDGEEAPRYVTASIKLDQPGVVEKKLVNGMLQVQLADAEATVDASLSAKQMAGYQHVLTATAYSSILHKVEQVCALHATNTVRYDALLIRNPAVQMRLAQLACFRYGIDCLTDYVIGDPEVVEGEEELFNNFAAVLQIPLVESMALNIYAERALMDGIDGMWELVRDAPLIAAVPHRSRPEKLIDYPYLAQLLDAPKYVLTSSDGSMEEQALTFLRPLLKQSSLFGGSNGGGGVAAISGMLQSVAGLTSGQSHGGIRLAAPHVNLAGMAKMLERDVAQLLQLMSTEKNKTDPTFVICVAQYISEVLTTLAVVYRCTAALNIDEEGRGHREWLLAQAFGNASAVRRQQILSDYRMARAATRVLKRSEDLDNYSTHPIELTNASPRNHGASSAKAAEAKQEQ